MGVRAKLASHLYRSALTTNPLPVPVARLTHSLGVSWTIDDDRIVVLLGGETEHSFPLAGTILDLIAELLTVGVTTTFIDPALTGVPADALLVGEGSSESHSTDALSLFTAPVWTVLDAYSVAVREADAAVVAALEQLFMNTAEDEVLDVWGDYFAVPRKVGEDDPTYYARIVRETLRPRNNRFAIEAAILDETGLLVSLREPNQEIFRLSVSGLSGGHHLQDGRFFTWNVFQPVYHSSLSLAQRDAVLAVIERNRPAGCLIVGEDDQPPTGYAEADFEWGISSAITLVNNMGYLSQQPSLLSATLFLSNARELVNSQFVWTQYGTIVRSFSTDAPLGLFGTTSWDSSLWGDFAWGASSVSSVVTQQPV